MPVIDFPPQPAAGLPGLPCWVRVRERRPDGYVVFDLSIGDPLLSVELILAAPDFEIFCRTHRAQALDAAQAAQLDADGARWRDGDAAHRG